MEAEGRVTHNMGVYYDDAYNREMAEANNWPMVPAGPGFEVLDEQCPNLDGEPVLAWRVGDPGR
jgi:hypothetical protein